MVITRYIEIEVDGKMELVPETELKSDESIDFADLVKPVESGNVEINKQQKQE